MSDVSDQVTDNAQAPKRITVDGQTVEEHSLLDQIAADKYVRNAAAVDASKSRGLRFMTLKPPGTA